MAFEIIKFTYLLTSGRENSVTLRPNKASFLRKNLLNRRSGAWPPCPLLSGYAPGSRAASSCNAFADVTSFSY